MSTSKEDQRPDAGAGAKAYRVQVQLVQVPDAQKRLRQVFRVLAAKANPYTTTVQSTTGCEVEDPGNKELKTNK